MDVEQARTFLAVVETGSFMEASKRIFVTQSTVSARIKTMEEQLGKNLFERSKAGVKLTPAGEQFQRHAQTIVRAWEHARLEISLPAGYETSLTVGGQYSLWDGYLLDWLARMRTGTPEVAIRAEMGLSETLMHGLIDGTIDLGVMYTPQSRPGFEVELLFEDDLILVATEPDPSQAPARNYVLIDWGPEFRADHALNFPEISVPGTYLRLGSLSLQYLLQTNASGYVPRRLVKQHLASEALHQVRNSPVFSYPAYVVYPSDVDPEFAELILNELRQTSASMNLL